VKYIALNGFQHSLQRYFNNTVTCIDRLNWVRLNAIRVASTIKEPTTVIGFSDGATAAITIGNTNPLVVKVYAHSPMDRKDKIRSGVNITLFRTLGDSTPTFKKTNHLYLRYLKSPVPTQIDMIDILPGPHEPVKDLATFFMKEHNHQFRNCLPYLPEEIL
jgi:hypothetical protein